MATVITSLIYANFPPITTAYVIFRGGIFLDVSAFPSNTKSQLAVDHGTIYHARSLVPTHMFRVKIASFLTEISVLPILAKWI